MAGSITLHLTDDKKIDAIASALSARVRRKIIRLCAQKSRTITELAFALNLSLSTMSFHLKILMESELIKVVSNPSKRGNEKIVFQGLNTLHFVLTNPPSNVLTHDLKLYSISLPVGSYCNFEITPPCGLVSRDGVIMDKDRPDVFHNPNRSQAELVYFFKGFLEYPVSIFDLKDKIIENITFSLELCSECPCYNNEWKSDITFWLNDTELCTYRSPGDFGGRRGKNNPSIWSSTATQYGILKTIKIDSEGTYLDETLISNITLADLKLNESPVVKLKIGVKSDSKYVGGINIFGKGFGDTDQDILFQVSYRDPA